MATSVTPQGIYPMLYAFFNADGTPDEGAMRAEVRACLAGGARGMGVLGLATEVNKLTTAERRQILDWVAEEIAGRVPLAVTIAEPSIGGQIDFARAARDAGASWVILQPPPVRSASEADLVRFFGAVADGSPLPVAIQNAPEYIGIGLGLEGIRTLRRNHPNFTLLKGEGPVLGIQRIIEELAGELAVFNGRGGLELTDNLRAGCVGMIPGPECFEPQIAIYDRMQAGDDAGAEALYREILPLLAFLMQTLDQFLCYGKRLMARRMGLRAVHDRAPALAPTAFGMACLERHAARLGPWPSA